MDDAQRLKQLAGHAALLVDDGMTLGLGSGSTAEACIEALGGRVAQGLRVSGVATSHRTEIKARAAGITLVSLADAPSLDLGLDGADEIDPSLHLIKGRGGALLFEKIVARVCRRWVIVAAAEKLVETLGTRIRLPVEVIPFGWPMTLREVQEHGIEPQLRYDEHGAPFVTDGGHYILDCATGPIADPLSLSAAIKQITGVVDHGLFIGYASEALTVDHQGEVTRHLPRGAGPDSR